VRPAGVAAEAGGTARGDLVSIPAGVYRLGSTDPDAHAEDGEGPVRLVRLSAYRMQSTAVSNAAFAAFVTATGYVTDAEREGWSFVFAGLLSSRQLKTRLRAVAAGTPWWVPVKGAHWKRPEGVGSHASGRQDHPVVHVSRNDAQAYAGWAGLRLPTEAEWEAAARGGLEGARFPWGDELTPGGEHRCNIWQGRFPHQNEAEDGFVGTAPAESFKPNGYGLFNMTGNCWEWCSDRWSTDWHVPERPDTREDPQGPPTDNDQYVIRGGSFLCHESYCNRYRVSARTSVTADSSTSHLGFRCAH